MPDTHLPVGLPSSVRLRHFGPATVSGVLGTDLEVDIDGACCLARLAMSCLYHPAIGDVVLVAASDEAAYVIGVLSANGPVTMVAPRDLRLWAPNGRIELMSASLVASADDILLQGERMNVTASRLHETFGSVQRVIRGVLDIEAGEIRARVRDMFAIFTRRFRASADEDVKIDGSRIDLG